MELGWAVTFALIASALFMTLIFAVARWQKRYDVVDIGWGLAFIAITGVAIFGQDTVEVWSVQTIAALLVVLWGVRLSSHISARWQQSKGEDARYAALRKQYAKKPGGEAANMYARVFVLQALLAVVIVVPVVLLATLPAIEPNWWTVLGAVVWLVGFYFESAADMQLASHIRGGKKDLLTTGVWRLSRHPNYFGEATMWWGVWLLTIGTPYMLVALLSPLTITVLVRFVSGVPMMEKIMSKREGWKEYAAKTSIFLPLPPKKR